MTERIASIVASKAPVDCPDRKELARLDLRANLFDYKAYLAPSGEVQCLGTLNDACTNCELRVASYTVDLPANLPEGKYRIPIDSIKLNPK